MVFEIIEFVRKGVLLPFKEVRLLILIRQTKLVKKWEGPGVLLH